MDGEYEVILEQEVDDWLEGRDSTRWVRHAARIQLLANEGDSLDNAYYLVLESQRPGPRVGELRCLILYDEEVDDSAITLLGISYFIGEDQRIFLLTIYQPVPTTFADEGARAISAWLRVARRENLL